MFLLFYGLSAWIKRWTDWLIDYREVVIFSAAFRIIFVLDRNKLNFIISDIITLFLYFTNKHGSKTDRTKNYLQDSR